MQFSTPDAGINRVEFNTGDAQTLSGPDWQSRSQVEEFVQADGSMATSTVAVTALVHRGLAEILGSARPVLDIRYLDRIFRDGFETDPE